MTNFFNDFLGQVQKGAGLDTGQNAARTLGSLLRGATGSSSPSSQPSAGQVLGPYVVQPGAAPAPSSPMIMGVKASTLALVALGAFLIFRKR